MSLGVSKAGVELDDLNALVGNDQSAIEKSNERCAPGREFIHDRLSNGCRDRLDKVVLEPGERGVSTHSSGVGAFVIVEGSLVVLRGAERNNPTPVTHEK